jgi:hypothetical protein
MPGAINERQEKQYISSYVVGETVTGFHVKQGKAILEFGDGGGTRNRSESKSSGESLSDTGLPEQ